MAFCVSCGTEKTEDGQRQCDVCLAKKEMASAIEITVGGPSTSPALSVLSMFKSMLLTPAISLRSIYQQITVIPSLIVTIIYSILFSGITVYSIGQAINKLMGSLSFLLGPLLGNSTRGMMRDFPYGEIFFKLFLFSMVQWAVLSFITLGVMKLWKRPISMTQAFNITGISKVYVTASLVLMFILSMIQPFLGITVFLSGVVFGYLAIHQALHPLLSKGKFELYILPTILFSYWVVEGIILKISM